MVPTPQLLQTPEGWRMVAQAVPPPLVLAGPDGRVTWELLALRWRGADGIWRATPHVRPWEAADDEISSARSQSAPLASVILSGVAPNFSRRRASSEESPVATRPFAEFSPQRTLRDQPAQGDTANVTGPEETQLIPVGSIALAFSLDATSAPCLALRIAADGPAFHLEVSTLEGCAANWLALDLRARPDEHFLGLGERFDRLDQRGNVVDLTVVNGASGGRTYAAIPFYISSAGYGLQLLSNVRMVLHLATPDDPAVVSIRCAAPSLTLRLIPGKSPKEILSRYTAFAGRPALPPSWVFGPWKSRDWTTDNQARVAEDIARGRKHQLAGTVELIDASWQPYYHSFTFDPVKFPDPAGIIHHAHGQGYRLVLWVSPWVVWSDPPSENYRYCAERGFFIKTPSGDPYVHRLANSPTFVGSCLDFTRPEAVTWWQEQIRRLVRLGVSGFKTDFGEQIPDDAVFADGRTGHEVHNVYPRLYNQATYAAMQAETRGILLARAAWDGSQAVSALWAGDQSSDFGPATGLPSVILAGQSAGLSGFPFWASDIGGYFGTPTDEVFIRWTQFGALSPIMQLHGLGCREPWNFAAETLAIYRRYAQLHMDLLPYILTFARQAVETGLPIMRALALEFPDDAGIWGDPSTGSGRDMAEHEYCFGDALLVAPVYWGGDRFRHAYLPAGDWRDFWTGAALAGGRVHRLPAPLELLPLVARAGALIPLLDPSADTCLPTDNPALRVAGDDLRLLIFGGANGHFRLYDGTRFSWDDATATLTIADSPVARQVAARLVGVCASVAGAWSPNDQPLDWASSSLNGAPDLARIRVGGAGQHRIAWTM
ncbi:MAG: hypothetical protein NT169_08295 [Chloroflexi bacterium]|nr:hypothetical protein [Chloroflexota bacterium]